MCMLWLVFIMTNKTNKRVALTLTDSEWDYIDKYLDTGRVGTNLAQLIRDHIKQNNNNNINVYDLHDDQDDDLNNLKWC